jgi:hypothetical protein
MRPLGQRVPIRRLAFSGDTPLEHMLRNGRRGIAGVLRFLEHQTFKPSL